MANLGATVGAMPGRRDEGHGLAAAGLETLRAGGAGRGRAAGVAMAQLAALTEPGERRRRLLEDARDVLTPVLPAGHPLMGRVLAELTELAARAALSQALKPPWM